MSTTEQMWFVIAIAGFVILMEAAVSYMGSSLFKKANPNLIKFVSGIIIFIIAVIMLFNVT